LRWRQDVPTLIRENACSVATTCRPRAEKSHRMRNLGAKVESTYRARFCGLGITFGITASDRTRMSFDIWKVISSNTRVWRWCGLPTTTPHLFQAGESLRRLRKSDQ
jgi:hypothetical protein